MPQTKALCALLLGASTLQVLVATQAESGSTGDGIFGQPAMIEPYSIESADSVSALLSGCDLALNMTPPFVVTEGWSTFEIDDNPMTVGVMNDYPSGCCIVNECGFCWETSVSLWSDCHDGVAQNPVPTVPVNGVSGSGSLIDSWMACLPSGTYYTTSRTRYTQIGGPGCTGDRSAVGDERDLFADAAPESIDQERIERLRSLGYGGGASCSPPPRTVVLMRCAWDVDVFPED